MLGLMFTALGGRKEDAEVLFDAGLTYVLIPERWTKRLVEGFGGFTVLFVCFAHGIGSLETLKRIKVRQPAPLEALKEAL